MGYTRLETVDPSPDHVPALPPSMWPRRVALNKGKNKCCRGQLVHMCVLKTRKPMCVTAGGGAVGAGWGGGAGTENSC